MNRSLAPLALLLLTLALGTAQSWAQPATRITLDQAIQMALDHNHALSATRTLILQNKAQEITAAIRPNPVFSFNSLFIPFTEATAENINTISEFDLGIGYTFERGRKRQHRIEAAKDQTSVTQSQVTDSERAISWFVMYLAALDHYGRLVATR